MKSLHYVALGPLLTVLIAAATNAPRATSAAAEPTVFVSVQEIGIKVALVGRLGQPLGKPMDVKGKWRLANELESAKDESPKFTVTYVNGQSLKKPVEFNLGFVKAVFRGRKVQYPPFREWEKLDGVVWTLRAYETGLLNLEPNDWWKEEGTQPSARPVWLETFNSELVGVIQEGK
jgi:hypothetical protein